MLSPALNSTDYSMKLKPTELLDLKSDTVKRAMDTIGNRIDELGLAEKSVQPYGQSAGTYQILIQLPGVDDPARAKELIRTAAVLEIAEVKDGPYASKDEGIAKHGGILPLGTKLAKLKPRGAGDGEQWVPDRQDPGGLPAAICATRAPGRTSSASGRPALPCRRTAASGLDDLPRRISAIAWRWCWTTRSSAWPPSRPASRITGRITRVSAARKKRVDLSALTLRSGSLPAAG